LNENIVAIETTITISPFLRASTTAWPARISCWTWAICLSWWVYARAPLVIYTRVHHGSCTSISQTFEAIQGIAPLLRRHHEKGQTETLSTQAQRRKLRMRALMVRYMLRRAFLSAPLN